MIQLNFTEFLNRLFQKLKSFNLDVTAMELDHIAYQASGKDDFENIKSNFLELGMLASEVIMDNRRVAVFKLHTPFKYQSYLIPALELIEPKMDQQAKSQLEHAEFVLKTSFEDFIKKYPDLNWDSSTMYRPKFPHLKLSLGDNLKVKFHKNPILEIIRINV